jgi:hypothetical protein
VKGKSKLLMAVGVFMALAGLKIFLSPSRNEFGVPEATLFSRLFSFWLLLSGIGIALHKRAALWFYVFGIVALPVGLFLFGEGVSLQEAATFSVLSTLIFGIPAVAVWFHRDRLEPLKPGGRI